MLDTSTSVGRESVPQAPEKLQRELRQLDARLRLVFNTTHSVWQIQERLRSQDMWSHVMFWHDGPWNDMQYRPLPGTAAPLVNEIGAREIARHGPGGLVALSRQLDSEANTARAEMQRKYVAQMADKVRRWREWAYKRGEIVMRRYLKGGRSRAAAIAERADVLRDLGLRG